ncbi:MAG: flagellin, partial [Methanomicrobium sp.]|nr:flagellin [Methanomicrobium sp.]
MTKIFNKDEGFTGLEAAIVLIAFVVVAAVFSYVVLGAGFFTTQKAQEVVYSSVDMASSSMEVLGNVYGNGTVDADPTDSRIDGIQFVVGLTAGGASVDLANTNIVFSGPQGLKDLKRNDKIKATATNVIDTIDNARDTEFMWSIIDIANGDTGSLLDNQKQVTIYAQLDDDAIHPN